MMGKNWNICIATVDALSLFKNVANITEVVSYRLK